MLRSSLSRGLLTFSAVSSAHLLHQSRATLYADDGPSAKKPVTTKSWSYYTGQQIADTSQFRLFTGNGNRALAEEVSRYLGVSLSRLVTLPLFFPKLSAFLFVPINKDRVIYFTC